MAGVLEVSFFLWAACAALGQGLRDLRQLDAVATRLSAAWEQEYALRRCGGVLAARANLAASAGYIASQRPELSAAAEAARVALEAELPSGSRCEASGPEALHVRLHQQKHPGQPVLWPNWVYRLGGGVEG